MRLIHARPARGQGRSAAMNVLTRPSPGSSRFAARLRGSIEGEVLFHPADRGRYSTDASIYQVMPVGVVVPKTIEDVQAAMTLARKEGISVLARGGGTSQCGQTVNSGLVLDCSKHLRKMVSVEGDVARVQPGITLGALNEALKPHGKFFPVDPSTWARCTIGGMAGNNSCGSKSIRYGLMSDNVLAIDAMLADGSRHWFGEGAPNIALVERLHALGEREAAEIAARFPHQLRRVGGYNLDALTPDARSAAVSALADPHNVSRGNLSRLLVGSEGTLAFSAALDLKLWPIKPRKMVGICQFPTFRRAMEAAQHLVTLNPEAVELVDRTMIDLGRSIPIYRATIDQMVRGEPDSLLIVEFHGHEDAPLLEGLRRLDEMMADLGLPGAVVHATDAGFQARIAEVREAGLNIMMSMKGDAKPVSFIEDCAVALPDLADYTERLTGVFDEYGVKGTWYAHASVGCLHVRPVLNMKDGGDVRKMREIAERCFELVREYKGSHSGEHGDGIVRSEFSEPMFGSRITRAFEAVKDAFDPSALLNPGRVVRAPKMDDRSLFRYGPDYAAEPMIPALDWSAHPNGFLGAVEMCNNNGTCRKFDVGTMCPSYRVTRDERDLTRGRANTLRLALTGQLGPDALAGQEVADAMSLCVSCKGCRRECPTGVDMARMKIEVQHAHAQKHGYSLKDRLVAALPLYAPWAASMPGLANLRNRVPALAWLMQRATGLSASRALPEFVKNPFLDCDGRRGPGREVILFADTFNRYFEPENLHAAVRVLNAAGFSVRPASANGRPLCCGRTYLAAGMVDKARAEARRTLAALSASDAPVIGLEPSCITTLRDEFLALLPGAASEALAARAFLIGEFLDAEKPAIAWRETSTTAHVHGHCHQKAFGAFPPALAVLGQVPGLKVAPIASSCCGMAGSFGYQEENQAASRAMAEASLLPAVRAAAADHVIVADGTSCRHQIASLSGRQAVHSVMVLDRALPVA